MSSVANSSTRLFWLIVLSAIFPPLAVGIEFGIGWDLLWNILLTLLVPFGGFIHSIYLLCRERYSNRLRNAYEPIHEDETETPPESNIRQTSLLPVNYPGPALSIAQQEAGVEPAQIDPPPYASPGTHITYDNKIQRNP